MAKAKPSPDELWRITLTEGHRGLIALHWLFRRLPSSPRCKMCFSPFAGFGGRVVGWMGFRPSRKNPMMCANCTEDLPAGGAEVETAVLFADIRGSSALAVQDGPAAYAQRLNRFYAEATKILVAHDAIIDKMIGDEVMALFVPGVAGAEFRNRAVEAALALTARFGPGSASSGGISLGAAVHCGPAYVGNIGAAHAVDLTALGETVNLAAHLQSAARPGEVVVTEAVHAALGHAPVMKGFSPRSVMLKGRAEPMTAYARGFAAAPH